MSTTAAIMEDMALFGAGQVPIENDPLPDDRDFPDVFAHVLETLFDACENTAMERFSEQIAWGFINSVHHTNMKIERELDFIEQEQRSAVQGFDGSEVMSVEIEEKTAKAEAMQAISEEMKDILDAMSQRYKQDVGRGWTPRSGSRIKRNKTTSSVLDAQTFSKMRKKSIAAQFGADRPLIGFSGGANYRNAAVIQKTLDSIRAKYPSMVLVHGGMKRGAEWIASQWADDKGVDQVPVLPNHLLGAAAPFERNERIIRMELTGAVVCPGGNIQRNFVDHAVRAGVKVIDLRGA